MATPRPLPYASEPTRREMDLHSRERALLFRLCRTLGPAYAVFGAFLGITITSRVNGSVGMAVGSLFMVPGITLWMASTMIRLGSRGWCVGAIVAGFFAAGLMLLGAAASVLTAIRGPEADSMLTVAFAQLLLGVLTCAMLYYAFRVLSMRGWYSAHESSIVDLRTVVAEQAVHGPSRQAVIVTATVNILLQAAIGTAGAYALWLTLAPVPLPAVTQQPSAKPSPLAAPYDGDIFSVQRGLPLSERNEYIAAVEQIASLPDADRAALDLVLAVEGQSMCPGATRPITREKIRPMVQLQESAQLPSHPPRSLSSFRFPNGIVLSRSGVSGDYYNVNAWGVSWNPPISTNHGVLVTGRALQKAVKQSGLKLTIGQARCLITWFSGERRAMNSAIIPPITALPDGTIEIAYGKDHAWITPDGGQIESPAVTAAMRLKELAATKSQRMLPIDPAVPTWLIGSAILCIIASIALCRQAGRARWPAGAFALPILAITVMVSGVRLIAALNAVPHLHWQVGRALWNPFWFGLGVALYLTIAICAIWIPLAILIGRRPTPRQVTPATPADGVSQP